MANNVSARTHLMVDAIEQLRGDMNAPKKEQVIAAMLKQDLNGAIINKRSENILRESIRAEVERGFKRAAKECSGVCVFMTQKWYDDNRPSGRLAAISFSQRVLKEHVSGLSGGAPTVGVYFPEPSTVPDVYVTLDMDHHGESTQGSINRMLREEQRLLQHGLPYIHRPLLIV